MPFDIEGARSAGWRPGEIIDHLSRSRPNFDINGAREAGYDDDEIAQFMATGEGFSRSPMGPVGAVPRGANVGLSQLAGAPVDLINFGLKSIGLPTSETPFGGSRSIRQGMEGLGDMVSGLTGGSGDVPMTYESRNQLPPVERIGAVAGETLGASVPIAMAPSALVSAGAQGGRLLGPVIEGARRAPGRFLATEAGMAGGAAQGAGLMEAIAPGNETARMAGEMVGSMANPTGLALRGAQGVGNTARNFLSGFTQGGRERRAAEYIVEAFSRTGEDPTQVLQALRTAQEMPVPGTVGQQTGSPTVLAIESQLGRSDPRFASTQSELGREGLETLRQSADRIAQSGDPQALEQAGRLRAQYYDELMQARLARAQREAQEAMTRVGTEGQPGRQSASTRAYEALDAAVTDARRIETELWDEIPRDIPLDGRGVLGSYSSVRSQMLPDDKLDPAIEGFISRIGEGQRLNSGDFLNLRREALAAARAAASGDSPNRALANLYGEIAEGALRDLSGLPGDNVDQARNFSRSMHDAFSRSFANMGITETGAGAPRVQPELLLEQAFGAGGSRGDVRLGQLQEASDFPMQAGSDQAAGFGPRMRQSQEDFLRSSAVSRASDPETGAARPDAIARFLAANETTLDRFPDAQRDIVEALSSQRALESVERRSGYAAEVLGRQSPLGRILRGDDTPTQAAERALSQGNDAYVRLANTAQKSGPEALRGLGAATLDSLMRKATNGTGEFKFARFGELLTQAPSRGAQSPIDLMVSRGAIDEAGAERLRTIVDRAQTLQQAQRQGREIDDVIGSPDMLSDLIMRVVGARIGSQGAAGASGASLVAASAGSRAARNLFANMPMGRLQQTMIEMVQNPELFEAAVSRAPSPERKAELARQVNAALIQAGIVPDEEDEEIDIVSLLSQQQEPVSNPVAQALARGE